MMLTTKSLWVVLGVALLTSAPVSAQISAPREVAQIAFGPLAVYPSLQLVDVGVDDNVFNDAQDPQSDYTLTVATKLLAVVRLGGSELLFQSGNDYVWFQDLVSERSSNAQYAVRLNLSASRFKPFIGAERVRTRGRRGPELDARARRIDRTLLSGLAYEVSPRTAITAGVRYDEAKYEEGERYRGVALDESLNRTGRGADAGVRYAVTPLTTLNVLAGYEEQTFPHSHTRDLRRYTVGPTIEFSPEAAIRGRVVAALELFKPDDPTLVQSTGLAYNALLNWSLFGRTTFDLGAGRNISYSYQDSEPYYLLTNARLTVSQPLPGWFEFFGGYDWEHMAYRWRRLAVEAGTSDRVDRMSVAHGGVGIRLGRGFSIRTGVERTKRRSVADPLQNFTRTRLLSTVTVGS